MGEDINDAGSPSRPQANAETLNSTGSSTAPHARRQSSHHAGDSSGSSRNQSSRAAPQTPQSRNFEFVLVTDNESRRQVRRHAMRQYMRQRRLDSIARLDTSRVPVSGWTTRETIESPASTSPSKVEDVQGKTPSPAGEDKHPKEDKKLHPTDEGAGSSLSLVPRSDRAKIEDNSCFPVVGLNSPGPRTSPGVGGKRDPFSCYPIAISNADHELIQHFVVTYPSMMYKFVDSIANNPMMEIFRQFALHDSLPFQAMLAIASKHRAGVEGKTESVQSLTHKMRALRLMNERIQADSRGQHDGTIYAVATMAVIEKWSKDASIERMHFKGLASMIRNRGGMRGMRASSNFLEKVLYWVDFSCAPKAIFSTCLPWTGDIPDTPPDTLDFLSSELHLAIFHSMSTSEDTEEHCDQFRACEDFLRFFRRLHELQNIALNSPGSVSSDAASSRAKRFSPGTQLHTILTMLPDYDHGIRDIRFIDEYTCMACLIFLNVALYDCYSKSSNFDRYVDWLEVEIQKLNPYTNPSITSVLWLFLNNGGYPNGETGDSGERCWVVSRMLRIAKRLEWKRHGTIWDRLRQVLIGFVTTQQECALGSDIVDEHALGARHQKRRHVGEYFWDEDEMRNEILAIETSTLTACPKINLPVLV
ncbi:hypothetical protein ASPWEDRAFT_34743 [Aspergillus wentii DTO 134E9]|uniref:Uncharacterized protein n=1 Tax=Aspergillus wentii DTO 134E9 TaxID=1073089 RepID=A0A1L9S268_ASPWE|nr:uncharacterized protein ASPWEDRAFT_34743 [Aspergillus wentii DTO 134E9]OJJ41235.1 hypothetical protein ASPWEDRAFT_34743 [Aspergillus wentii DTO 134E9]